MSIGEAQILETNPCFPGDPQADALHVGPELACGRNPYQSLYNDDKQVTHDG